MSQDVHNHLGDCGGDKTNVSQGEVGEEEVHGGVDVGITADSEDDEQVSQESDQVHGQEQEENVELQFWIICQSQEIKIGNICLISGFHIVDESEGKME